MSTPCENCGSDFRVCIDCDLYNGKYIENTDNATNGDMVKAMFGEVAYLLIKKTMGEYDWWNAPYQKGGKE